MKVTNKQLNDRRLIELVHGRLNIPAFSAATAVFGAISLTLLVAVVLLRGPIDEEAVGTHLALLAHYVPGFTVSWKGALVGALWVGLFAGLFGAVVAIVWNSIHRALLLWFALRARLLGEDVV